MRSLLREQHPDLAGLGLRVVDGGWDNQLWRLGDEPAVRLPRTRDPATDLAAAWLLLPAGAAPRFFEVYADADAATVRRARGWAVLRGLSLVGIGRTWERGLPGGKRTWGPAGRATLDRVLASG
ncbi:hypothetical protein ACWGDE_33650 [Streptomyces sp. NPDC054956]